MSKEELLQILRRNAADLDGDYEQGHWEADRALIAYINDPEIEEAYKAVGKWYA